MARMVHEEYTNDMQDVYCKEFAELLHEKSDGRINLQIYQVGQIGNALQGCEILQNGGVEFAMISPGNTGTVVPENQLFSLHFLFPQDMAEEITQETFTKALKAIDTFDGRKDIRAWLFTIARNTYYTHCKRQKIYVEEDIENMHLVNQEAFTSKIIDEESALLVHRFLHHMREPYKEVFTLRVFGELPFEKIAVLFGKTPNWARVTFYRAKKEIIEYMEGIENGKNQL